MGHTPIPTSTVYVDTETGGLRPKDRPWEIALVVTHGVGTDLSHTANDGQDELYVFHVADFDQSNADPQALRMSGFYDRHPMYARDEATRSCSSTCFPPHAGMMMNNAGIRLCLNRHGLSEEASHLDVHHVIDHEACIARQIDALFRDRHVVACNPVYDVPRIERLLNRGGFALTSHYRPHCATGAAAIALGLHPASPNAELGAALGVSRDQFGAAHGALPDALYARALDNAARAHVADLHARAFGANA